MTHRVMLLAASVFVWAAGSAVSSSAEELYTCLYNGTSSTYRAAEMTRMRALGAVCDPLSAGERVTCSMDGVKLDYSRQEARRVMKANPYAVCEMGDTLIISTANVKVEVRTPGLAPAARPAFKLADKEVVHFNLGSARVSSYARSKLANFADNYGSGGYYFTITGYADASGSSRFNHTLSLKRAGRVRDILRDFGISTDRIVSTSALGEESLRLRTRNGVRLRYNRAVEVRAYR